MNGSIIGDRYVLGSPLGTGGMGEVYRAFDRLTGELVALKRILLSRTRAGAAQAHSLSDRLTLAQEFRMLASLRHPHIISVRDYGFDRLQEQGSPQPYFTMDLLDHPLTILAAAQDRPMHEQLAWVMQLLQALAYLHRRGILHRDLKPDNVLIHQGQIKVLDFGLAMPRDWVERPEQDDIVGTLAYMAPELFQGHPPSEAADLYAVGIILYELLAGRHPFDTESPTVLITAMMIQPPDLAPIDDMFRPVLRRLLAKDPAERYPTVDALIEALCEATDQALPVESASIRDSYLQAAQFVGRDVELNRLRDALNRVIEARQGSLWLVAGESGVGKSRLLDELRTQALVQGVLVLRGQGVEGGGLAYQLWRDVVRRLVLAAAVDDFSAGVLRELIPDIETLLGRVIPPVPLLTGQANQQRLGLTLVNLFRAVSQPMLLLLEDLQWTWESLELLRQVQRIVTELPLLIVGSFRDDERPDLPDELRAEGASGQIIKLERLNADAISALSLSMLGEAGTAPEVVRLLQRETEGNVFFLVEVVRALAEEVGRLSDIGKMTLPASVFAGGIEQIVRRRLARVPAEARALLDYAAVAGRAVDRDLLHAVSPQTDLDRWLTECLNAAVLEVTDGQWRFAHDKLREKILADLPPDDLPGIHATIASVLEQLYPDNPALSPVLALHWRRANVPENEQRYLKGAAEQAADVGDFREALALYNRLLTLTEVIAVQARAETLLSMGRAYINLADYPTALELLQQAEHAARLAGDKRLLALIARSLGIIEMDQASYERSWAYSDAALRLLDEAEPGEAVDKARALALISRGSLASRVGELDVALRAFEESLAISQRLNDHENIHLATVSTGMVYFRRGQPEETLRLHLTHRDHCLSIGNLFDAAKSAYNIGLVYWTLGRYEEAKNYVEECSVFARQSGQRWEQANSLNTMGYIQTSLNQDAQALACFREALVIAAQIGATSLLLDILAGYAQLRARAEDWETAAAYLALALHHPATNIDVQHTAEPILAYVRENMAHDRFEAAYQRGQALDLNTIITVLSEQEA